MWKSEDNLQGASSLPQVDSGDGTQAIITLDGRCFYPLIHRTICKVDS